MALCSLAQHVRLSSGADLRWFDSWADIRADAIPPKYHTILTIHGICFNSRVWEPIVHQLPPSFRLVAYNQRGYEGSSPHLAGASIPAGDAYLSDLVNFFDHIVNGLKIPASADGGGVILLGWSKGAVLVAALLSQLLNTPSTLPASFTTHLAAAIFFEPPGALLHTPAARSPHSIPSPEAFLNFCLSRASDGSASPLDDDTARLLDNAFEPSHIAHSYEWGFPAPAAEQALGASPVPLGLLVGTATQEYFADLARALAQLWARSASGVRARQEIQGGNHCAMVLVPQQFVEALKALVADLTNEEASLQVY